MTSASGLVWASVLLLDLDQVVAEGGLDGVGGLTYGGGECCLLELGNHLAPGEGAELAALRLAAWVVGVGGGERGEVAAGLDLLQQVFGLGPGGGSRSWRPHPGER